MKSGLRKAGIQFLKQNYGISSEGNTAISKFYPNHESPYNQPVWWFDIPVSKITDGRFKELFLLCQGEERKSFDCLCVPVTFFIKKTKELDLVKSANREIVRLHLSADRKNRFQDLRGKRNVAFSHFLLKEQEIKSVCITDELLRQLNKAIHAALAYEKETGDCRKLGITGEVGEVLTCYQLGLKLVCDPRASGYDAINKQGKKVQIKTRRSEGKGLPRDVGRLSSFSKHEFDYALLVLLDHSYKVCEIWRADYRELKPIIERQKRRNPNLAYFKRVAKKIFKK